LIMPLTGILLILIVSSLLPLLAGVVFLIAFLYASVGFGGATGYLAVMSFFDIPSTIAASTALSLNVIVSGIAFVNFARYRHLHINLLWPFLVTSIPAAFIGGTLQVGQVAYQVLLNLVLFIVALRMLLGDSKISYSQNANPPIWQVAILVGAILGLLSGILGIGGGVFLAPIILLAGWGSPKHAAASSAGFIFLNSIAGLTGRAWGGTLQFGEYGPVLIVLGILGGLVGSYIGARHLPGQMIRRLLGVVLLIAVTRFLFVWLGN
jgi:uncharacterized protein